MTNHAPKQGLDKFGHHYKGGQFIPFYVPREIMPQVEGQYYEDFKSYAASLLVEKEGVDPFSFKPHQRIMVDHAVSLSVELAVKPIIVSIDGYIIDGHHRWYWHCIKHIPISVYEISLTFEDAIEFTFSFPQTYCYRDSQGNEY